ncbi:MAG TPA: MipA/OmpV family protein [Steroidobacteraceae bacterium]|nr:MipA/OmpV family protein [Steroidobacteraceae bacterium]
MLKILAPCLLAVILACAARAASAQTPSPMQEWQYEGGIALENLFVPKVPKWDIITGIATSANPIYSGASQYGASAGPVISIRYRDRAFISSGEGVGVNVFVGKQYCVSLAVGLDLGRRTAWHYSTLHGLGDIPRAPFVKLAGTYVISKRLPILLRGDIRKIAGGAAGLVGDLDVYMPLPGSSRKLVMFAGPSVTLADRKHLQTVYGISPRQALLSQYPVFDTHGGLEAVGFGFSATRFFTPHILVNTNLSCSELLGSAGRSPIVERKAQVSLSFSAAYRW